MNDVNLNWKAMKLKVIEVVSSQEIYFWNIKLYWIKNNKLFHIVDCQKLKPEKTGDSEHFVYSIELPDYEFP